MTPVGISEKSFEETTESALLQGGPEDIELLSEIIRELNDHMRRLSRYAEKVKDEKVKLHGSEG